MTFSEWYNIQGLFTTSEIITNGWSIIFQILDDTLGDYTIASDLEIFEKRFKSRITHIGNEFSDILNGTTLANIHKEFSRSTSSVATQYGNAINDTIIGTPTTALAQNKNEDISKDSFSMLNFIKSRYGSLTIEDFIKVRFKDLFVLVY